LFLKKAKQNNSEYIESRNEHDFKSEQLKRVFLLASSGALSMLFYSLTVH